MEQLWVQPGQRRQGRGSRLLRGVVLFLYSGLVRHLWRGVLLLGSLLLAGQRLGQGHDLSHGLGIAQYLVQLFFPLGHGPSLLGI
uniref:hypothetical protein n=1 Tax=uncultured Flavonifractor sp. TaxID=1193534 RepID=UPI00344E85C6